MFKKVAVLTRPTPARQDAPFRGRGRSEVYGVKNNEVRDATAKERHVFARARGSTTRWIKRVTSVNAAEM
jgi:hypothetical protein